MRVEARPFHMILSLNDKYPNWWVSWDKGPGYVRWDYTKHFNVCNTVKIIIWAQTFVYFYGI